MNREEVWPASGTTPARTRLERRLAILVCAGRLDVVEAQRAISKDWVEAHGGCLPLANKSNGAEMEAHPYAHILSLVEGVEFEIVLVEFLNRTHPTRKATEEALAASSFYGSTIPMCTQAAAPHGGRRRQGRLLR